MNKAALHLARALVLAAIASTSVEVLQSLEARSDALAAPASAATPVLSGDPVAGAKLYQSCMGCHSLDDNDVGPKHRGVVGRKAGTVVGYAYSPALRASGIVWTPDMIDRWLQGPQKLVPGAKMYFTVANPKNRADIIAFLAQQH
jgi:cytochrome c